MSQDTQLQLDRGTQLPLVDVAAPAGATPGPWNLGLPGGPAGPFWSLVNQDGEVVAMQITTEANARLIAAAPDLLAALKALIALKDLKDAEGKTPAYESHQPQAWVASRAAIRQAEGGE
ncbi:MAG TPA: hypothetical protein VNM48_07570 [Chloroflexota bacterium]|nr:hypothetical protein [Chloroflexota bacterium]